MEVPHHYADVVALVRGVRQHVKFLHGFCPAHDDDKRSLSIKIGDNGALMMKCHAGKGCTFEAIARALNVDRSRFFPPDDEKRGRMSDTFNIKEKYDYRDAANRLVYQTIRLEPKDFRQRRPNPRAKEPGQKPWLWDLQGIELVPYRLPELLATPPDVPVWICEGEKGANILRDKWKLVATNFPLGAGKFGAGPYAQWFIGRKLVILPDDDPFTERKDELNCPIRFWPGIEHARDIALGLLGFAASIRIVRLFSDQLKKDPYDYVTGGGTRDALFDLAKAAPVLSTAAAVEEYVAAYKRASVAPHDAAPTPDALQAPATNSPTTIADALAKLHDAAARMSVDDWFYYARGVIEDVRTPRR